MVRGRNMSRDGEIQATFFSLYKDQVLRKPQNAPVHGVALNLGHMAAKQTRVCPSREP